MSNSRYTSSAGGYGATQGGGYTSSANPAGGGYTSSAGAGGGYTSSGGGYPPAVGYGSGGAQTVTHAYSPGLFAGGYYQSPPRRVRTVYEPVDQTDCCGCRPS